MLSIEDIKVRYGALEVLKGISADLTPGSFTTLIGPNGTGKTSLLKAIGGLVPACGEVSLSGQPLTTPAERSSKIAYLQQDIGPKSSLTILEVVLLGRLNSLGLRVPSDLCDEVMMLLSRFGIQDLQG
ncbi:MAG: ABC transporter ATP-binding protein, partial [Fimbriimonadaceae bacterium]|nr:ABC transporter ATP-binding protein [Alphaproteobacteria bacterium]